MPASKNRFMEASTLRRTPPLIRINGGGPYTVLASENSFMETDTLRRSPPLIWTNGGGLFNVPTSINI